MPDSKGKETVLMSFIRFTTTSILGVHLLSINVLSAQQSTLAVIPLDAKGVSDIEASVLTERLGLELFRTGQFIVLERGKMEEILNEQNLQMTGCVSEECLVEVGRLLGVEQMVAGSVSKIGITYSVILRLISAESGAILQVASYDHKGAVDELLSVGMSYVARDLAGVVTSHTFPNVPGTVSQPDIRYFRWQFRVGHDVYGPVLLASIHSKRTFSFEGIGINSALTAGTVGGIPLAIAEIHFLSQKSNLLRTAFLGIGMLYEVPSLSFGASVGFKIIFAEFRVVSAGFYEMIPGVGLGIRF